MAQQYASVSSHPGIMTARMPQGSAFALTCCRPCSHHQVYRATVPLSPNDSGYGRSRLVASARMFMADPAPSRGPKIVPLPPPSDVKLDDGDFVQVGSVAGAFGVYGDVKLHLDTDEPQQRFKLNRTLFLQPPASAGLLSSAQDQGMLQLTISKTRSHSKQWVLGFKEITDRSQAEQLLKYEVYIRSEDRSKPQDPDEYYVQDLVGCRVFQRSDGKYVGKVIDLYSGTGTHDTLQLQLAVNADDIKNNRLRTCMIPFARALVPYVNVSEKQVVVDPPEGLLDLVAYQKVKTLTKEQRDDKLQQLRATPLPVFQGDMEEGIARQEAAHQRSLARQAAAGGGAPAGPATRRGPIRRKPIGSQPLDDEDSDDAEQGDDDDAGSSSRKQPKSRARKPSTSSSEKDVVADEDEDDGDDDDAVQAVKTAAPVRAAAAAGLRRRPAGRGLLGRRRVQSKASDEDSEDDE